MRVHDLAHRRKAETLFDGREDAESFPAHALEGIGRGSGLERASAEDRAAMNLHGFGDDHALLFAFDGARTRHDGERPAADLHSADLDDAVFRMELAVRLLERFGYAFDLFDFIERFEEADIDGRGVAAEADDRLIGTDAHMGLKSAFSEALA